MQYAGKLLLVDINNQLQFLINIIEDENGYRPKSTGRKTNIIYIYIDIYIYIYMQNNWSPCLQEQHSCGKKPYLGVLKHFTILKMEVQFLLFIYLFIYLFFAVSREDSNNDSRSAFSQ